MGLPHQPNRDCQSRYDYRARDFPIRIDYNIGIPCPNLGLSGPHTADENRWNYLVTGNFCNLHSFDDHGSRIDSAIEIQEVAKQSGDVYQSDFVRLHISRCSGSIRIVIL